MRDSNENEEIKIEQINIESEGFFKISNSDLLKPFFMNIVSHSNHWLFIASNGGLSAGRKNSNHALFPYYTDDKITESFESTGSKTIFIVYHPTESLLWEPFSDRHQGQFVIKRNLYKSIYGNKVRFEEVNHTLKLTFAYQWNSSDKFGFVRQSILFNHNSTAVSLVLLDGLQNILPSGVPSDLQNQASNLVDAYKRSELDPASGLGIYALSAVIVDRAEPSESLAANVAWSCGLENPSYLLCSEQLRGFRRREPIHSEYDVKAERGAYFIKDEVVLKPGDIKEWMIIADVNKDHAEVIELSDIIRQQPDLKNVVLEDIKRGTEELIKLNASADGIQLTSDRFRDARHFSNVMFNIMRGGVFDNNYQLEQSDFQRYLASTNIQPLQHVNGSLRSLGRTFSLFELNNRINTIENSYGKRLALEYLPLRFSRRHGDPSRPWNKFSINTHDRFDGSKILDYEGNWRDIFQNWEALGHSFPEFVEGMIRKFLNASTFDGYNPYRVTKDGFDWETIEPDDPWSYIGYWGDHQIIYLLKFLEFLENHQPQRLSQLFDTELFVYANIPYRIKSYQEIVENSKDTIDFDVSLDAKIRKLRDQIGGDGALLQDVNQNIHEVSFLEKILATTLAKISNFIPEAGIWMNTQRPEWNDANNALVGNGVSMVTLYYLRRFFSFFQSILENSIVKDVLISKELLDFFDRVVTSLDEHVILLNNKISDKHRKDILNDFGGSGSSYRNQIYHNSFSGEKKIIELERLRHFSKIVLQYLDHSIRANKREDHLYHAYNLITISKSNEISISRLSEMLEGQVAVLSSGYLSFREALALLDSLKTSALFRNDQGSYLLYPNKDIPGFLEKNNLSPESIMQSRLLMKLVELKDYRIVKPDVRGGYHFSAQFRNSNDLQRTLDQLAESGFEKLVGDEAALIHQLFEEEFDHQSFTGRSGTFFGYEGLGSIYWHMVSKLRLAVQEVCIDAIQKNAEESIVDRLVEHYYGITEGIGVHRSPVHYGAFPTDPYSHTPGTRGAQQPGMTGQVKEDILCRFGELGVMVKNGVLGFNPSLLRKSEFLREAQTFKYVDVHGSSKELNLPKDSLCFTYCQVPVIYKISNRNALQVEFDNARTSKYESLTLDLGASKQVFRREGTIVKLIVELNGKQLRQGYGF